MLKTHRLYIISTEIIRRNAVATPEGNVTTVIEGVDADETIVDITEHAVRCYECGVMNDEEKIAHGILPDWQEV